MVKIPLVSLVVLFVFSVAFCLVSVTNAQYRSYRFNSARFRCPTIFPTRSSLEPNGVVVTGFVDEVMPDSDDNGHYMATVLVRRVLYGPRNLRQTRILISGFGNYPSDNTWCHTNVQQGDSWIFTLQAINYPDYFRLNSSLIKITLNNLERYDAIIADEPYRPLTSVVELPCEKKYCENNANCVEDTYSADQTKCVCLNHCKTDYSPVCGSNDETYKNECELRLKSCYIRKNLFVKSLTSCYSSYPTSRTSSSYSSSVNRQYAPTSNPPSGQWQPSRPSQSRQHTYHTNRVHTTTINRYSY